MINAVDIGIIGTLAEDLAEDASDPQVCKISILHLATLNAHKLQFFSPLFVS